MATVTGSRATATFPTSGLPIPNGTLGVAWGVYTHGSNLAAATIIEYCKVPRGATVIGGFWQASDLDTGTEELDIDIGWAGNGTDAADPDGFGNLGLLAGDVVTDFRPVAGIYYPFINIIQDAGFMTFAAETTLIATVNTDAATGGTGLSKLVAFYV